MASKKAAPAAPATQNGQTSAATAAPAKGKAEVDPNMVQLADVCKELGITGQVARRKLRAAKLPHEGRWQWPKDSEELKKAKIVLTKAEAAPAQASA